MAHVSYWFNKMRQKNGSIYSLSMCGDAPCENKYEKKSAAPAGMSTLSKPSAGSTLYAIPCELLGTSDVYLFRKEFRLLNYSGPFIIHISADNRYRLYVNGHFAGMGPARSDLANWYYETTDISSYLKYGNNVIAEK